MIDDLAARRSDRRPQQHTRAVRPAMKDFFDGRRFRLGNDFHRNEGAQWRATRRQRFWCQGQSGEKICIENSSHCTLHRVRPTASRERALLSGSTRRRRFDRCGHARGSSIRTQLAPCLQFNAGARGLRTTWKSNQEPRGTKVGAHSRLAFGLMHFLGLARRRGHVP